MKPCKIAIFAMLLLAFFIPTQSARADVAPPPVPKLGGLEPLEYQKTEVQMVYERVEMELFPSEEPDDPHTENKINVTAYFLMHNLGKVTEKMEAVFPASSLSCPFNNNGESFTFYEIDEKSFDIRVNGQSREINHIVTAHPNLIPGVCDDVVRWVAFDVTFPPSEDVLVRVSYTMRAMGGDQFENFEYVLETGAGWKGPITRGYIVVKFPYVVEQQAVLEGTTSGYQTLYNEIFWAFNDLEPTSKDNIQVNIVAPQIWQKIQTLRQSLDENPGQPEKWLKLAQVFDQIARTKPDAIRSEYYFSTIANIYEQGIASNPQNADLYAYYAQHQLDRRSPSPYLFTKLTQNEVEPIARLVSQALALDPDNQTAQYVLSCLKVVHPDLTFIPPPTIPPTATSAISSTPTETPPPSVTPKPSQKPIVVTVIKTKIITATPKKIATATVTATITKIPTYTPFPTPTLTPTPGTWQDSTAQAGLNWILWPFLLIIGLAGGIFISKKKWI
jgi:hypothetical protein